MQEVTSSNLVFSTKKQRKRLQIPVNHKFTGIFILAEMQKTSGSRLSAVCSDIFEKADDSGACSIQKKTAHLTGCAGPVVQLDYSIYGLTSHCERLVSRRGRLVGRHIILRPFQSGGNKFPILGVRRVADIRNSCTVVCSICNGLEYRFRTDIIGGAQIVHHNSSIATTSGLG